MVKQTAMPAKPAAKKAPARAKKRTAKEQVPEVNFGTLHMNTLKRYKKHYSLRDDWANKAELVDIVQNHFNKQEVIEMDTIVLFSHVVTNRTEKDGMY
jgi:hypothetical protein